MPIHGRSKNDDGEVLHQMSEVTLALPLADIRRVAEFLLRCVGQVESGEWRAVDRFAHKHLIDSDRAWRTDHPECDVIVIHPSPELP